MNTNQTIKKARRALRQADNVLKAAAAALRNTANTGAATFTPPAAVNLDMLDTIVHLLRAEGPRAFKIGDEIDIQHALGPMRWAIIGIDADKVKGCEHTLTLQNITPVVGRCFDAPDLEHPWGRNRWHASSVRAWLNNEFYNGFRENDRKALRLVQKKTFQFADDEYIYTRDPVFLLSASEAGFEIDGDGVRDEGAAYPYFKGGDEARQFSTKDGKNVCWWLRSPYPWNGNSVRVVHPSGALNSGSAYNGNALAAACVIG